MRLLGLAEFAALKSFTNPTAPRPGLKTHHLHAWLKDHWVPGCRRCGNRELKARDWLALEGPRRLIGRRLVRRMGVAST